MSDQAAPDSPFVTYLQDAARPGYNYRDHYPDSPDPEYVPIKGDEDFVESNSTNYEEMMDLSSMPLPDISQTAASPPSPPTVPSLLNATLPMRFGAPISSTSVANPLNFMFSQLNHVLHHTIRLQVTSIEAAFFDHEKSVPFYEGWEHSLEAHYKPIPAISDGVYTRGHFFEIC